MVSSVAARENEPFSAARHQSVTTTACSSDAFRIVMTDLHVAPFLSICFNAVGDALKLQDLDQYTKRDAELDSPG